VSFKGDLGAVVSANENGLLSSHSSWLRVALSEVASILNGYPFDSAHFSRSEGVPLVRIRDVRRGRTETRFAGEVPDGYWVNQDDLLVGMDGDFNCALWGSAPALLNQRVCKIEPNENLYHRGFLRWVLGGYLDEINKHTSSVTVKHLSSRTLSAVPLPLPPLAEQRRIADKLDELLAMVDACRERLDRIPSILKRFRQAVLAAATSGELTRDWRERRGVSLAWSRRSLGELIERIEAGLNVKCDERPPERGERGLVKISAVTWGAYDDDESKTLPASSRVSDDLRIGVGDFLISRANTLELVGACVVVGAARRPVFLSDKVLGLVMPEELKTWVLMCLQAPSGRRALEARATGSQLSMRNLSQAALRPIEIAIPGDEEREKSQFDAQKRCWRSPNASRYG
jgi:type I restriction enzyme S subunit